VCGPSTLASLQRPGVTFCTPDPLRNVYITARRSLISDSWQQSIGSRNKAPFSSLVQGKARLLQTLCDGCQGNVKELIIQRSEIIVRIYCYRLRTVSLGGRLCLGTVGVSKFRRWLSSVHDSHKLVHLSVSLKLWSFCSNEGFWSPTPFAQKRQLNFSKRNKNWMSSWLLPNLCLWCLLPPCI
jgi:hypothetical protein